MFHIQKKGGKLKQDCGVGVMEHKGKRWWGYAHCVNPTSNWLFVLLWMQEQGGNLKWKCGVGATVHGSQGRWGYSHYLNPARNSKATRHNSQIVPLAFKSGIAKATKYGNQPGLRTMTTPKSLFKRCWTSKKMNSIIDIQTSTMLHGEAKGDGVEPSCQSYSQFKCDKRAPHEPCYQLELGITKALNMKGNLNWGPLVTLTTQLVQR